MSRITSRNNYESNLSSSLSPIIECNTRGHLPENAVDPKVKFVYSEKTTKFCETSTVFLTICTVIKSKVEISQNFVTFSEYMNFKGQ